MASDDLNRTCIPVQDATFGVGCGEGPHGYEAVTANGVSFGSKSGTRFSRPTPRVRREGPVQDWKSPAKRVTLQDMSL